MEAEHCLHEEIRLHDIEHNDTQHQDTQTSDKNITVSSNDGQQ
jgi:hypothetical protein